MPKELKTRPLFAFAFGSAASATTARPTYLSDSDCMKILAGIVHHPVLPPRGRLLPGVLPISLADTKMVEPRFRTQKPGVNATETMSRLRSSCDIVKASRMTEISTRS